MELVCEILALLLSSDDETTGNRALWHLGLDSNLEVFSFFASAI
jgi:hypothetical protein